MNTGVLPKLEKIRESIKLLPLPQNIHSLMKALADDNISYGELADIINHYPEMTGRLLSLANSAWSAPVSPITSTEQACSRLGSQVVRSVCIALAVSTHFDPTRCPEFDPVRFWTSSMLVAEGAYLLASKMAKEKLSDDLPKSAQTAGVLHNLGLLWFAENLSKETGSALRLVLSDPQLTVSDVLLQSTGADYCIVGGWIGRQWKIPEILTVPMEHHLNSEFNNRFWEMTLIVGAAATMAAAMHKNINEAPINFRLSQELGLEPDKQLQIFDRLFSKLDKTRDLAKTLFTV